MENVFLADVLNQPAAMRNAIKEYKKYGSLLEQIANIKPKKVLFCGMGSSHYCSQPAVIKLINNGIDARVLSASEVLYYERALIDQDTLLVLTSQSGESGEIVSIIKQLPVSQQIIGITNDMHSTLGKRSTFCLEMHVAKELAVSTRTYLASLILSDLLATALCGESVCEALAKIETAIDALEELLANHVEIQTRMSAFLSHPATINYIARGYSLTTAECGALFTRETAKYPATAFDSAEFRHGPFEMVDDHFCAMVFAPDGNTYDLQAYIAEAITKHNGRVVFVTDRENAFPDNALVHVIQHRSVGEANATLIQIAAAQLFANDMALYLGHAPGIFRQSSKVTAEY